MGQAEDSYTGNESSEREGEKKPLIRANLLFEWSQREMLT